MNTKLFVFAGSCSGHVRKLLVAVGVLWCCSDGAHACNVPVFRFALERWRPDPYRAVLLHRGPLSDMDRTLMASLQEQQDKSVANVMLRPIDVSSLEEGKDRELFTSQDNSQLPWLVVNYPEHLQIKTPVWKGAVSAEAVTRLTGSPVRTELVKRLIDGQTAVWLFLESGQPEKDDPAVALLESELKKLEQELKLPELTASPDDALLATTPLRLAFSLLRVPRGVPSEQILIEMLLHSEPDLSGRSDPLVFPVFGRGRALFPLVGAGITKENIQDSASFLVGPCSCQVKELNPGFDLLLTADWDGLLSQEGIALTAVATQERSVPKGEVELVPIPAGTPSPSKSVIAPAATAGVTNHETPAIVNRLNAAGKTFVSVLLIAAVVVASLLVLRR